MIFIVTIALNARRYPANYINAVREAAGQWEDGISSIEDFIERCIQTIGVVTTLLLNAWGHDMRLPEVGVGA
jgi:hypothetical protein